MCNGVSHIDKPDFLEAYYSTCKETISQSNITVSFATTRVLPYNLERVLTKLNTQLRTPTLPPRQPEVGLERWAPETLHNTAELELQTKAIKDYLQRRTRSPPSPLEATLDQLVKGCAMSMNSAILLKEEVRQLQATNAKQVKKRAKKRRFIARGGTLTIQEGLALQAPVVQAIQPVIEPVEPIIGVVGGVGADEPVVRPRAPRTCSLCRSLSHTARTCPTKEVS
jgi:hypothetical protein